MAKTVIIEETGGPENMKLVDWPVGQPGPGQILIRHEACGLNFIDVYQRSGVYPLPLPCNLGMEGAGVIEAVGEGVSHLKEGDRAAYASAPPGSYSEARVMNAMAVCKLPDSIGFDTGAAMMLKGLTTQYLFRSTGRLTGGETVLFHAAAGGVGLIACQWARAMGVRLIGTAGSDEKCALAKSFGADDVLETMALHMGRQSASPAAPLLSAVQDLRKLSDTQVQFHLSAPNADFPYLMADYHLIIYPAGYVELAMMNGIGTGLYRVTKFDAGRQLIGTRVENHYKDGTAGWFDQVELVSLPAAEVRAEALRDRLVDVADLDTASDLASASDIVLLPNAHAMTHAVWRDIGVPTRLGFDYPMDNLRAPERWWQA